MRSTFQVDGTVAIEFGEFNFDLHNDFDFVGYEYRPTERKARFDWARSDCSWVPEGLPVRLSMVFDGVSNFTVQKRDDLMPFTEDDCVSRMSFLPPAFDSDSEAVCVGYCSDDEHLSICFQSGSCVKIWAESVRHEDGA
jgi:hypothetical protein